MANILAAQNGNFSSSSTWTGGVVPTAGDFVYSNNKTIWVDTNVTCFKLCNKAENGATAGGVFNVIGNYTLDVDLFDTGATTLCQISANSSSEIHGQINGGTALVARGVDNLGTGTLTISGLLSGGSAAWSSGTNYAEAVRNSSTGNIVVSGNILGGMGNNTAGLHNFANGGNVTVYGNLSGNAISTGHAIRFTSGGNLTVNGNLHGMYGYGLTMAAGPAGSYNEVTLNGNLYAPINNAGSGYGCAIACLSATTTINGNIYGSQGAGTSSNNYGASITQTYGVINVYGNIYGGIANDSSTNIGLYVAGGTFASPVNFNFVGNLYGGSSRIGIVNQQNKAALRIALANANLTCGEIVGGLNSLTNVRTLASNSYGLWIEGAGTVVNVTVPELKNTNSWYSPNIYINNLQATVNLTTAGIYDDINSNLGTVQYYVIGNNAGTLNITGNVYGKDFNVSGSTYDTIRANIAIGQFSSNATTNVVGNLVGGICGTAFYNGGGTTTATKIIGNRFGLTAYTGAQPTGYAWYGIANTSKLIVEEIQSGEQGNFPAMGNVYLKNAANSKLVFKTPESNSVTRTFTDPLSSNTFPLSSDVRYGISYAGGNLIGSCYVPSVSSVAYGVPVGNSTGQAILSIDNLLNFDVSEIGSNSIWKRLKNCSTVASTGNQMAALV